MFRKATVTHEKPCKYRLLRNEYYLQDENPAGQKPQEVEWWIEASVRLFSLHLFWMPAHHHPFLCEQSARRYFTAICTGDTDAIGEVWVEQEIEYHLEKLHFHQQNKMP